ncbi:helicase-related protein, partial [Gemmatimonas sp.]|uniref:helicase-related protein n=1 Tax=Gemmatimonas sp. TaxID=1962908 RepID=UPI0035679AD5
MRVAYLPDGELIRLTGGREIESVVPHCESPSVESALLAYVAQLDQPEKILVFSNARLRVDALALQLRPMLEKLGYVVCAHHGSLAQRQREASEVAAKTERAVVVFATSTLEIGIDIGDIDLVVLDGPAPDVPALLQRVGRGNRRTERTRVMACAGSLAEALIQSAMLSAARDSYLGPIERGSHFA